MKKLKSDHFWQMVCFNTSEGKAQQREDSDLMQMCDHTVSPKIPKALLFKESHATHTGQGQH